MTFSAFRRYVQAASTVLSNSCISSLYYRTVNTNALKGFCVPFLNCYACPTAACSCPAGALQHFMAIHTIPYYVIGFLALVGLTIGRMACGWLCPFGFFQDLMYKIKSRKFAIPYSRYLPYVKYAVLVCLVLIVPFYSGVPWFSKLCPMGTLTAGLPWVMWNPVSPATGQPVLSDGPGLFFVFKVFMLIGFLAWFVVSKRPFCKVACPVGAIFSLFNRYSLVRLSVGRSCSGCDKCKVICPMDLNVAMDFESGDCIRCLECTRCGHVQVTAPLLLQKEVQQTHG
ncbi:MAG: 4Fe-4S binding protein [Pseudomonadota bacterium]